MKFFTNLFNQNRRYLHEIKSGVGPEMSRLRETYTHGVTESRDTPTSIYAFRELILSHESKVEYLRGNPNVVEVVPEVAA